MADLGEKLWRLRAGPYLGEISALSFVHMPPHLSSFPLLLAGSGSELHLYSVRSGKLLSSLHVLEGIRVHGISLRSPGPTNPSTVEFLIAVYGERRVKLFLLRLDAESGNFSEDRAVVKWTLFHQLPRFDHWVLDVIFLKEENHLVAGLSDNSVALWDITRSNLISRVKSSERCLLYTMRMWGDNIEALRVASGTIYNEIIVWKLSPQHLPFAFLESTNQHISGRGDVHLCRLTGHEGSIFRIAWSSDASKLMSVSDDRSARIWMISDRKQESGDFVEVTGFHLSANLALFGHNARIWDCCISDSIIITVGEDCTCRMWGMDGKQLLVIKEHIGRGIWRCQYDPVSSLLITAGFDSAIKVHLLHSSSSLRKMTDHNGALDELDQTETLTISAPKVSNQHGLMDSKSEYVRCLRLTKENVLYVATNNGYLYRVELRSSEDVKWTELAQVCKEAPIICMDLISTDSSDLSVAMEDVVAVGDGKGKVTVVRVVNNNPTPEIALCATWPAEKERQLLGVYWCKSLACRHLFTADPRGILKLWNIGDDLQSDADTWNTKAEVSLVSIFTSPFGARITCLDASIRKEVLICGDQRGNVTMYSFPNNLIVANSNKMVMKAPLLNQFRGAHGISCVTSVLIATLNFNQSEIRTTGGDGCICYFKYNEMQILEFIGMKQVKELSTIQSVPTDSTSQESLAQGNYAIGFTSTDFIMWNLTNETKALQIPCGGWRRPYSYYLGVVPEYQNCFAYLKDHNIHVHRLWMSIKERQLIPRVLHLQYHGREVHSLCFISFGLQSNPLRSCYSWIATGCEDGTVRLTRYMGNWCNSKLLGEHVGGSAVRSIYFVSTIHTIDAREICSPGHDLLERKYDPLLLISVGAKQVLTSWVLSDSALHSEECHNALDQEQMFSPTPEFSSIYFQWLSTHTPPKLASAQRQVELSESTDMENDSTLQSAISGPRLNEYRKQNLFRKQNLRSSLVDQNENDWRYMAVTAFLVKHADSRLTVCFIVVAGSDATLTLRALLLPHRLWLEVATLVPQTSPVLALQHVVIPGSAQINGSVLAGNAYIIISGSTNGSITFWDLTETVEDFMQQMLQLEPQMLFDSQRRPKTGRGSQGGRWWKSLIRQSTGNNSKDSLNRIESGNSPESQSTENISSDASPVSQSVPKYSQTSFSQTSTNSLSSEVSEVRPFYVLNYVHQSGVNCLHVSEMKDCLQSRSETTYCILSGGDDQAVHYLAFYLTLKTINGVSKTSQHLDIEDHVQDGEPGSGYTRKCSYQSWSNRHGLRIFSQDIIDSAHSSAVKGIWTDGVWAFSCGLDQRIRCWKINTSGNITELTHLIISVPEPEALHAMSCDRTRSRYQIAVAGRGMQMVEFDASFGED